MKYLFGLFFFFVALASKASVEQSMHESGKIYVVIGVVTIIFIGIVIYLVLLDKKLNRIEKEMKDKR